MINNESVFTEKQPKYRYYPLIDGTADVFIYRFKEERKMKLDTSGKVDNDEEQEVVEQSLYVYEMSGFKVSQDEISEDDIKADPISYFGYKPLDRYDQQIIENLEIDYRLSCLELGL